LRKFGQAHSCARGHNKREPRWSQAARKSASRAERSAEERMQGEARGAGDDRLEAACARAIRYDDRTYMTIKRILTDGLEASETPPTWRA